MKPSFASDCGRILEKSFRIPPESHLPHYSPRTIDRIISKTDLWDTVLSDLRCVFSILFRLKIYSRLWLDYAHQCQTLLHFQSRLYLNLTFQCASEEFCRSFYFTGGENCEFRHKFAVRLNTVHMRLVQVSLLCPPFHLCLVVVPLSIVRLKRSTSAGADEISAEGPWYKVSAAHGSKDLTPRGGAFIAESFGDSCWQFSVTFDLPHPSPARTVVSFTEWHKTGRWFWGTARQSFWLIGQKPMVSRRRSPGTTTASGRSSAHDAARHTCLAPSTPGQGNGRFPWNRGRGIEICLSSVLHQKSRSWWWWPRRGQRVARTDN